MRKWEFTSHLGDEEDIIQIGRSLALSSSGSRLLKIPLLVTWEIILVKGNAVASTMVQTSEMYGSRRWGGGKDAYK